MVNTKFKILGFVFFSLFLMMLPALLLDYKASEEFNLYSLVIAVIIVPFFWPLYKFSVNQSGHGVIRRWFIGFFVLPLGVMMFGWAASVGTIGLAINRIIGEDHVVTETVMRKGCETRKCFCEAKIHITSNSNMASGSFCIDESLWNKIEEGQKIRLSGVSSRFGFDVDKFEIPQ